MRIAIGNLTLASWMILTLCLPLGMARAEDPTAGMAHFEKKIRPVLVKHCYECHSAKSEELSGGLRVDSRQAIRAGGDSGAAVTPGDLEASVIVGALRHDTFAMPPDQKLPDAVVADFEKWIEMGAPDPREGAAVAKVESSIDWEAARQRWSFQPITPREVPAVKQKNWPWTDVDRFLLAKMEAQGLTPAADAKRVTLLRRLHFALIGLPPKPEEIEAFLADDSPQAVDRVVERLLNSPHFGERWGRHWLDVVRFAESSGGGRTLLFHNAWRYRDYVIDSLNADKPFDQMIREQIAGDLMQAAAPEERAERLTATGFLALGPTNYELQDKELLRMEVIDEQIDTIGRAFLGMTVGCARCHDHKFDPISSEDYYGLAGIFRSTKSLVPGNVSGYVTTPLPAPPALEAKIKAHEKLVTAQEANQDQAQQQVADVKAALKKLGEVPTDLANLEGIVIDDDQAELVGQWTSSSSVQGYLGSVYRHDGNTGRGTKSATFAADLPQAGKYEVRVSYTHSANRASNAHVAVVHAEGESVKRVNQRQLSPLTGNFASLGEFEFAQGAGQVTISNQGADGYVIVDAVQFIPLQPLAEEPADPEQLAEERLKQRQVDRLTQELASKQEKLDKESDKLKKLEKKAPKREIVMSVRDQEQPADYHICIRGNAHNLGEVTRRSAMRVVAELPSLEIPAGQSGRLQLARWIANEKNPLPARVLVNRVWQHLFGAGLVTTPDNFGVSGAPPSHAALLDHLAHQFMADGWSVKQLVRRLVHSRAFAMSSRVSTRAGRIDPDNIYLSHFSRQRLDAEALRDSLLATADTLQTEAGGPSIRSGTRSEIGYKFNGQRRSVYVPRFRNAMPPLFAVFDMANPNLVTGHRPTSTLPTQALFFMNSEFVLEQAQQVATDLLANESLTEAERVELVFLRLLGRQATAAEKSLASEFLQAEGEGEETVSHEQKWTQLCQSLYCSIDFRYAK